MPQTFSRDNEFEPIQEGGMNDYVYLKRKPITQPFKLVVERYVPYSLGITDPLANGTEFLLPMLLFIFKGDGMAEMDTSRFYTFTGGVVMGKQYGALDAERSGLLTETITIGYNHMYCTTIPVSDDAGSDAYSIVRDGITMRHPYGVIPQQNEEHWDDIDIDGTAGTDERFKAKLWKFDGKNPKGTGDSSHNYLKRDKQSDKAQQRKYSFAAENNKNYRGSEKSVRSAQNAAFSDKTLGSTLGIKELTTEQMIEKSKKFALTEDGKSTGNGTLLARRHGHEIEIGVKDMIRGAKLW